MIDLWFSWFLHTHQVPLGTPGYRTPQERVKNAIQTLIFLCMYTILFLMLRLSGGKPPPPTKKLEGHWVLKGPSVKPSFSSHFSNYQASLVIREVPLNNPRVFRYHPPSDVRYPSGVKVSPVKSLGIPPLECGCPLLESVGSPPP